MTLTWVYIWSKCLQAFKVLTGFFLSCTNVTLTRFSRHGDNPTHPVASAGSPGLLLSLSDVLSSRRCWESSSARSRPCWSRTSRSPRRTFVTSESSFIWSFQSSQSNLTLISCDINLLIKKWRIWLTSVGPSCSKNPPQNIYSLYKQVGINCFIAAAIYVAVGAVSLCQVRLNKRQEYMVT